MNECDHRIFSRSGLNFWGLFQQAGGALHLHRRGQGSNPHSGFNFQVFLAPAEAAPKNAMITFIQFFYRPYHLK